MIHLQQNHTENRTRFFEPYVRMVVENSKYIIKTADSMSELLDVLAFRGRIFAEEYNAPIASGALDIDRHDFQCDHLIIKTRDTDQIVGTYRMLCSRFTQDFYSSNEFSIGEFLSTEGVKLELGRACIAKEHRKGAVLHLLWRGVIQYAMETKADYLFGCSSVKTESYGASMVIRDDLEKNGNLCQQWSIEPVSKYRFTIQDKMSDFVEEVSIPPLLRTYIKAGAKVCAEPAYDREFHCLDYLTILKLDELKDNFERKYKGAGVCSDS
jgi:putative hemolysin